MLTRALLCSLPLWLIGSTAAQATEVQEKGVERLRAAWAEVQAAEASFHAAAAEARRAMDAAAREDPESAGVRYLEAVRAPQDELMSRQRSFVLCFGEVGFDALDPAADRRLMLAGLSATGAELVDAEPTRAILMCEALLTHYPETEEARRAVLNDLWRAQVAAGRVDAAISTYERFVDAQRDLGRRLRLQLVVGDLQAIRGDVELARESWTRALEAAPKASSNRPSALLRPELEQRLSLVGRPAPEVRSDAWIGQDARPLSALRGSVVIVDFWATWCEPCRAVMPELDAIYADHRAAGLEVVGFTRFHESGYLPANREQLGSGGELLSDLDAGMFRQHLVDFRRNAGIRYPFVIGDGADFDAFGVAGIPTQIVVDRDGTVAMVVNGASGAMVVKAVARRLLADKQG